MIYRSRGPQIRRGVVLAEAGTVYSIAILLLMGTLIVGLEGFRYQEVANLAGEGARWASLHGATYRADHQNSVPTPQDVIDHAVLPRVGLLDPSRMTATLVWNNDTSPKTVSFTLIYQWSNEMFSDPLTFRCTSTQPVSD